MISVCSCATKCSSNMLENIDESGPATWLPVSCATPETPTEAMEFLSRSWSLSAKELSKALSTTNDASNSLEKLAATFVGAAGADLNPMVSKEPLIQHLPEGGSPPVSPRNSDEIKELLLIHQVLNPEFLSSQQLLRNGLHKNIVRGKTVGRWLKDQKERKKQVLRTQNAQLHAVVSVAGVAAAVAALVASLASPPETSSDYQKMPSKISAAIAPAAALVASHCIEMAEEMGADRDHILRVVHSAISAKSNGDIMALTAGAATALRGAAILRARLEKGFGATNFALAEDKVEETKESNIMVALNFVSRGGELLKRTRKGALHWKQVSFSINSNWQVVAKMKSKHIAGTFTKKKKCIVSGVNCDIPAWHGREREAGSNHRAYFGIVVADRTIELECSGKGDKLMWTEGIQYMLNCRGYIA